MSAIEYFAILLNVIGVVAYFAILLNVSGVVALSEFIKIVVNWVIRGK